MINFEDSKICGVSASEESLDRVDVLVWALTTLYLNPYEK
jgi:phage terminase large subunit-like protein